MTRPHRNHPLWYAYALHRVSGLVLALFLPVHFYVLSLSLRDRAAFEGVLKFSELGAVKIAEFVLVFLLAVHMFGGLRLMAFEFLGWTARQKTFAALAVAAAFVLACGFLLSAWI